MTQPLKWLAIPILAVVTLTAFLLLTGPKDSRAESEPSHASFGILKSDGDRGKEVLDPTTRMFIGQSLSLMNRLSERDVGVSDFHVDAIGSTQPEAGVEVVVFRSDGSICLAVTGEGGTCGSSELAGRGLFSARSGACGRVTVTGLAPDGIDELSVEQAGSLVGSVPVDSNVFHESFSPVATILRAEESDFEISLPLAAYSNGNSACQE